LEEPWADPGDFLPTSLDDSLYPFARIFIKVLKVDSGYPWGLRIRLTSLGRFVFSGLGGKAGGNWDFPPPKGGASSWP